MYAITHLCMHWWHTLQHTATHCNRCITVNHSCVPWRASLIYVCHNSFKYTMMTHTATRCNTLQYTAIHCNTLQQVYYSLEPVQIGSMDEDDDTHCNSLQHTATGVSLVGAGAAREYGWGWLCLQHHFWVGRNGVASFDNSSCCHHVLCTRPVSILSINIYLYLWNIKSLHIYM